MHRSVSWQRLGVTQSLNMVLGYWVSQIEVLHPTHKHKSCLAQSFASAVEAGMFIFGIWKMK